MDTSIIFKDESYAIIGACFEVYKCMGNGFFESVYQECLAMEFGDRNISYIEQPNIKLKYKNRPLKKHFVPDFLCFGEIILELKAEKILGDDDRAQILNYLKATDFQLGLLVNFGHYPLIESERYVNLKI